MRIYFVYAKLKMFSDIFKKQLFTSLVYMFHKVLFELPGNFDFPFPFSFINISEGYRFLRIDAVTRKRNIFNYIKNG